MIGVVYYRQRKIKKAENYFTEALNLASNSEQPADLAELWNNLGNIYRDKHKYTEAEALLKRALSRVEEEAGLVHPVLTFTLSSLGELYTSTGRYAEAEAQYQRALKILQSNSSTFDTQIARLLHALSASYGKAGRKPEADATLAQAATIARRNLSQHVEMAPILEDYSALLKNHGQSKEAEQLLAEVKLARSSAGLVIRAHQEF
jgi:tetratricopeptide (TPR) repeat protein